MTRLALVAALLAAVAGCGHAPAKDRSTRTVHGTGVPDALALDIGADMCGALDRGMHPGTLLRVGLDAGFTPRQAAVMLTAAATDLCPAHGDRVRAGLSGA